MTKFYKYVSVDTAQIILKDSTLKFTSPIDFNDPFDYHPYIDEKGFNKFVHRINNQIGNGVRQFKKNHLESKKHLSLLRRNEFRQEYTKNISVSCFSESPFILPMWAHYADNHSGCVIEFEYKEDVDFINQYFSLSINQLSELLVPLKVNYSTDRPPLFDENGNTNTDRTGLNACLTKSDKWSYEEEVRVITAQPAGIYTFDRVQMIGVYFGMKIKHSDKKELSRIINDLNNYTESRIKKHDIAMTYNKFDLYEIPFRL